LVGGGDLRERGLIGHREIDRLVGQAVRCGPDPADGLGIVAGTVAEPGDHGEQRRRLRGVQRSGGPAARGRAAGSKAGEEASDRLVAHDREATKMAASAPAFAAGLPGVGGLRRRPAPGR
jgi:hypothetical protein